jgi:EmrB/QacA subfamily drug resistance transporter
MSSHPTTHPAPNPKRWLGLAGIGTGIFVFTLDINMMNVALPTVAQQLGASLAAVQWVPLVYFLVITALGLGAARLGDMHGHKRAYLFGLGLFIAGALLCSLAPNIESLIVLRALQGVGAVFVSALGGAVIAQTFPPTERGRAMGVYASCVTVGVAAGPTVGAFVIELASWRWMFLVSIVVASTAIGMVSRVIPDIAPSHRHLAFDWAGTLLIAVCLGSFSLALTFGPEAGFTAPLLIALFAAAAIALLLFLVVEARVDAPILDLAMFANIPFSAGLLMSMLAFVTLGVNAITTPFYLQLGLGLPVATVGLLMAISPIIGAVIGPVTGALADRFGPRWVSLAGLTGMALGGVLLARLGHTASIWDFVFAIATLGFGMGFFSSANNSAVLNTAPRDRIGTASGLLSLVRTLGQGTGVPVAAALFGVFASGHAGLVDHAALLALPPESLVRGTQAAFLAGGLSAGIGAGIALWMVLRDRNGKRRA